MKLSKSLLSRAGLHPEIGLVRVRFQQEAKMVDRLLVALRAEGRVDQPAPGLFVVLVAQDDLAKEIPSLAILPMIEEQRGQAGHLVRVLGGEAEIGAEKLCRLLRIACLLGALRLAQEGARLSPHLKGMQPLDDEPADSEGDDQQQKQPAIQSTHSTNLW